MRTLVARLRTWFGRGGGTPLARHLRDGVRGEREAARYLKRRGHRILLRNYENEGGELDLVTREGDTMVFVEVKARSGDEAQDPFETVTPVKWSRVERAARIFLSRRGLSEVPCRFDLVTVVLHGKDATIEHVENAHEARTRR